ncbi:PepSY-associated TM helix domain-containing protein [Mucilaginibacter xinganensis]|uniref:Peptidase n=1 Tax=Mucilaginibacter xinganensis TaxID=1234841 RepID=A0A223NZ68_9SPHI|nr:PepSY-associated TM helix domain-containing protein [Mucilaginibacter xinganensis]ASU34871.1 peptidase [Mucilaginibacter xinganensis]
MTEQTTNSSAPDKRRATKHNKNGWKKQTASWSRWLHTYLSMISFIVVLFFAATGFTLNHADWFSNKPVIKKYTGVLNAKWVKTKDTASVDKLDIVEFLRRTNGLKGSVSDLRIENNDVSVSFNGPGYAADVFIDRDNGGYKITETRLGLVAILNDLHKGRDTGKGWSVTIDLVALFMILVSLTGIIMMCFIKKKRSNGLLLGVLGFVVVYLLYIFLVK